MRKGVYAEGGIRLQEALSQARATSHRAAETLIAEGRVRIDGQVARSQGIRINPHKRSVHVDGERVFFDRAKHVIIAVNKPISMVSTMSDPGGHPTLTDLVVDYPERLYNMDRLDIDTSGLLLLTNGDELANRLAHPSYKVPKTYVARVHGEIKPYVKRKLTESIELEDGPIKTDAFRVTDTYGNTTSVEIVIHERRNCLVRRMMDQVGYPVRELVRIIFGPIHLDHLQSGSSRHVRDNALKTLYSYVGF